MNRAKLNGIQDILNEMVETSLIAGVGCLVIEKGREIE